MPITAKVLVESTSTMSSALVVRTHCSHAITTLPLLRTAMQRMLVSSASTQVRQPPFTVAGIDSGPVSHIDQCKDWDIKLVSSNVSTQGTVQVCYQGVWGTISDDNWGTNDARVICRQLGFYDGCE